MPVHVSPRPLRTARPIVLAALLRIARVLGYRLAVVLAVAGTLTHALLFWPESVFIALIVATAAAYLPVSARNAARAR